MTIDGWSGEEINFKEVISPQNYQSFLLLLEPNSKHIFSLLIYFQIGVIFCEKTTLLSFETVQICQKTRPKWPGLAPIAAVLRPKMLKFFLLFLLSRDLSARMPWNRVVGRLIPSFFSLFGRCRSFSLLHAFAPGSSCEKNPEQFIRCASERGPRC